MRRAALGRRSDTRGQEVSWHALGSPLTPQAKPAWSWLSPSVHAQENLPRVMIWGSRHIYSFNRCLSRICCVHQGLSCALRT